MQNTTLEMVFESEHRDNIDDNFDVIVGYILVDVLGVTS